VFRRSSFQKHARRLPRARLLRLIGLIVVLALAGLLGDQFPARPIPPANEAWTIQTVHDGDTVTAVAADGREERIRLLGIDAPEYRQPHGRAARAALEQKVRGQPVHLESHGRDQYDRLLGTLWIDQRNLNRELVAEGHAWVFDRFTPPAELREAQQAARRDRRGLWATPDPLRPSDWRQAHPRHP
jgi:micrococcal nuclease